MRVDGAWSSGASSSRAALSDSSSSLCTSARSQTHINPRTNNCTSAAHLCGTLVACAISFARFRAAISEEELHVLGLCFTLRAPSVVSVHLHPSFPPLSVAMFGGLLAEMHPCLDFARWRFIALHHKIRFEFGFDATQNLASLT